MRRQRLPRAEVLAARRHRTLPVARRIRLQLRADEFELVAGLGHQAFPALARRARRAAVHRRAERAPRSTATTSGRMNTAGSIHEGKCFGRGDFIGGRKRAERREDGRVWLPAADASAGCCRGRGGGSPLGVRSPAVHTPALEWRDSPIFAQALYSVHRSVVGGKRRAVPRQAKLEGKPFRPCASHPPPGPQRLKFPAKSRAPVSGDGAAQTRWCSSHRHSEKMHTGHRAASSIISCHDSFGGATT
eukprot:ctg_300.g84